MKKSVTLLKSISAIILSLVLAFSCVSTGFAQDQIIDEDQKLQYLYTFNDAVNAIKEEKPSFKYKKTAGISKEEQVVVGSKTASDISDDARKYLSVLIDSFFNPDKGLINNFIAVLTETGSDYTQEDVYKGIDTTNLIPVQGESYVSDLTVDDVFILYAEEKTDLLNPENQSAKIRFAFPETALEDAENSALGKVFDLPSGAINPVVIGGASYDDVNDPLDDVKFDNFTFHDAYVQADLGADGKLTKYTQKISYTFSFSFYDILRMLEVYAKTDFIEIGLAIANPILQGTGSPEVTAREVLKDTMVFIRYDVETLLYDFDWNPRYFGDVDNDGAVTATDARAALRYSVGLDQFKNQESLIYADVDFDGVITATDARFILRASVELEDVFSEVPEGEEIKIVVIVPPEPEIPEEKPDEPSDGENAGDSEEGENGDSSDDTDTNLPTLDDVTTGVSDFIDGIFDIINGFKGDGSVSNEGINSIIQSIKDIVAAGKGDITGDNNGGVIVVPDATENA